MGSKNIGLKLEIGALLTVIYALLELASDQFMFIPGVVGLRLMNALPIGYGLLFGRLGACACALGTILGQVSTNNLNALTVGASLGAFGAAFVPFRIWQGLRSDREPEIVLADARTFIMFAVLAVTAAVPPAVFISVFADKLAMAPFVKTFSWILLQNIAASVILGGLVYKFLSPRFLYGINNNLWLLVKDTKTATRRLSIALLRLTLTALCIGLLLTVVMSAEMNQDVIIYTMGILGVVILTLANW
jgi:energy-coupling factor transport system substrate-specific component